MLTSSQTGTVSTHQIPRRHPSPLLNQSLRILINLRRRLRYLIHRNLIPAPRPLNIPQRLLQTPQLNLYLPLRRLCVLHRHLLKGLNALELFIHIVGFGGEGFVVGFDLVDDGAVLEDRAVVGEVDGGGLVLQLLQAAAGVVVTLFELLELRGGGAAEGELRGEAGPV